VDENKFATNELAFEHTLMRAWSVRGCASLITWNAFLALDIIKEDMFIQL
jgi:hypothetical protein